MDENAIKQIVNSSMADSDKILLIRQLFEQPKVKITHPIVTQADYNTDLTNK
jgi:hypothetical protein